jgi:hypothetical protein
VLEKNNFDYMYDNEVLAFISLIFHVNESLILSLNLKLTL